MISYLQPDGKRVVNLDASLFKESACLKRVEYLTQYGYREGGINYSTAYGTAFHVFRAVLRKTGNTNLALQAAIEKYSKIPAPPASEYRDMKHLSLTCLDYIEKVYRRDTIIPLEFNGEVLIEQKFSYEYYESDVLKVHLCGTVDELGQVEGTDQLVIADCKTTSVYNTDDYFRQYEMSPQLKFYVMMCQDRLKLKNVGAVIDGVFLNATRPTQFKRSDMFNYTDKQIDNLRTMINRLIADIEDAIRTGEWSQNITQCNSCVYTPDKLCKYFRLYSVQDEELREHFLQRDFVQKTYDPMTFDEG